MSDLKVFLTDPQSLQAEALLRESHALLQSLYAAEDTHFLEISELCADNIRFFAAWDGDLAVGCIALAIYPNYGEVKSMFVSPAARRKGVGALLLDHLISEAKSIDLARLNLETGNTLYAAHRLYEQAGFTACGAFGAYAESPASVFMTKQLT